MKKITLIILLLSVLTNFAYSQGFVSTGKSFIMNYSPKEYKGHVQNWGVSQDSRGVIYIANGDGLMEYDGKTWKMNTIPRKLTIRSVDADKSGRIYIGSVKEFGYFEPDKIGNLQYFSLSELLSEEELNFTNVWQTKVVNGVVYFRSRKKLFKYLPTFNKKETRENLSIWSTDNVFDGFFIFNKTIYVRETKVGLKKLENKKLVPVKNGEIFISKGIAASFFSDNEKILLAESRGSLFYYYPDREEDFIEDFPTEIDEFIKNNYMYSGTISKDSMLVMGFSGKGCYILNRKGELINIINKATGLQTENVYSVFTDNRNNLWLMLSNGISQVEVHSKIKYWDFDMGLVGMLEAIMKHEGILHIATHRGLFKISDNKINQIEGPKTQYWSILSYIDNNNPNNKSLLIGNSYGVYELTDNKLHRILRGGAAFEMFRSKKDPSRIFVSISRKFKSIKYENNKWIDEGYIEGVEGDIRGVIEDEKGEIWLGTFRNGIIRVILSDTIQKPKKVIKYDDKHGLPSLKNVLVYHLDNKVVIGTEGGLYKFNKETEMFIPETTLPENLYDGSREIFSFIQAPNGNVWLSGLNNRKGEPGIAIKQSNGEYIWNPKPFKRISEMMVLAFYVEGDSIGWIGGSEGLFRYKLQENVEIESDFNTIIRKVSIGKDSVIFGGIFHKTENNQMRSYSEQTQNFIPEIDYNNNSIRIEFSCLSYQEEDQNQFSFYLEGYEDEWLPYTSSYHKEYTNMREGEYIFHLKSKNVFGEESVETIYKFIIQKPWYRTILAYVSYVVFLFLFFYIIIKLNSKRLKAANVRLENIVSERTHEILLKNEELQTQKEEIVSQNEELYQSREEISAQRDAIEEKNIELEKLSIVASKTDNAVIIMDAKGNLEWANEGFERLFGCTLSELIKKRGRNMIDSSTNPVIRKIFNECIKSKKSVLYESKVIHSSKKESWVQTTLTPILDRNNNITRLIAIDSDISKVKRAEENIKGSIRYAQTIQNAILPNIDNISEHFENFILFRPKDIVSGDFYKYSNAGGYHFILVVDCTGHGVPGAFMSLIGNSLLNEIINEKQIYDPAEILTQLNKGVISSLKQEKTDNNDGMDVCLCRIDRKDTTNVIFSGAKRDLMYYSESNNCVEFIKGDRKSIGGTLGIRNKANFSNNKLNLSKGDIIYLTSDGYIDQNDKERRRFGLTEFQNILKLYATKPLKEQKVILENALDVWQKGVKQRDDITVLGIKI